MIRLLVLYTDKESKKKQLLVVFAIGLTNRELRNDHGNRVNVGAMIHNEQGQTSSG